MIIGVSTAVPSVLDGWQLLIDADLRAALVKQSPISVLVMLVSPFIFLSFTHVATSPMSWSQVKVAVTSLEKSIPAIWPEFKTKAAPPTLTEAPGENAISQVLFCILTLSSNFKPQLSAFLFATHSVP